jgi:O-antigen/teichoic acid export membrane protein
LIGLGIVVLAPLARLYFHEPRVVPVIQWLAVRSILAGFENIGAVNFRKDLRFSRFFIYNVIPKLVSFAVTITLAFAWRNYWALVVGILTSQLTMTACSFAMHGYRPRFGLAKISEIWSFSGWTLVRTVGTYLNSQLDQILIGGLFGTAAMGRYAVAADVASSPSREVNEPMVAVLYPVMARAISDSDALRTLFLRAFAWSAIICISASVGVTMVAHDLIDLILGRKWLDLEPFMGWLALEAGFLGLSASAYVAFDAVGKPHMGAKLQWQRVAILLAILVPVTLFWKSMVTIAVVRMIATALFVPALLFAVGREVGITPKDYFAVLWRPTVAAGTMACILCLANALMTPGIVRLLLDMVLGAGVFVVASCACWMFSGSPPGPERDLFAAVATRMGRTKVLRGDVASE